MDTVIRISRPEDLVAYIPYALGFRPRDSVAFVGLRSRRPGVGLTTRVDLAGLADPEAGPGIVAEVADCLVRDGCDDALVVMYTDVPRHALAAHPVVRPALERLRALSSWADAPGPWVVGAGGYGCWGAREECAPASGDSTELEQGMLAATMVAHGKNLAADREALQVPRTAGPASRRAAVRAASQARAELLAAEAAGRHTAAPPGAAFGIAARRPPAPLDAWRDSAWGSWRRLVSRAGRGKLLLPADLGRLAVSMCDAQMRDGVLYCLTQPAPARVPTAVMAIAALDDAMAPGGPPPRPERVAPVETVLRASAACLGPRLAAHPLAALAWLAWWSGDGARADVLSQQVLTAGPGTRLAELVQQTLAARMSPGWVSRTSVSSVRPPSFR